jgi:hypothetical protein
MKRATFCLSALGTVLSLSGCGGMSRPGTLTDTPSAGRATFTIHWPERDATSRLIPLAANSVRVLVYDYTQTVRAQELIVRPTSGSTSTLTFPTLPVGSLTVTATAYPQADGTGVALATGTATLTIRAGENTTIGLTMLSTITALQLSYTPSPLKVGMTSTLSLGARDAAGNLVLTSPSKWQFSSSDPTVARVLTTSNQLEGLKLGTTTLTGKETESGVMVQLDVKVLTGSDYFALPLTTPAGYSGLFVYAVNNKGWVAGELTLPGDPYRMPFLWKPNASLTGGTFTELGRYQDATYSRPLFLSDTGVVLLDTFNTSTFTVSYVLWENGSYRTLPVGFSAVTNMNNLGDIVGVRSDTIPVLLKADGTVVELFILGRDISDSGYISGETANQPWLYKDGNSTFGSLPGGFISYNPNAVNNFGLTAGELYGNEGGSVPSFWDGVAPLTTLPFPSGYDGGRASGISDAGVIVGAAFRQNTNPKAVCWRNGVVEFLQNLVPAGTPALDGAESSSGTGYIVCSTFVSSVRGVLLIPASLL